MALDFQGILGGIGGAASDIFGASGHKAAAKAYDKAAGYARQGAKLEQVSTDVSLMQTERRIYKTLGAQTAAYAGAGLASSGTAGDVYRDSQSQGALDYAMTGIQGAVNVLGQEASAAAYAGQAASERAQAGGGLFGGILKAVGVGLKVAGAMSSDRRLKDDIKEVGTYPNGLPMYEFRYKGQSVRWRGVMADDVEKAFPDAVTTTPDGYKAVYYSMLGIGMERV